MKYNFITSGESHGICLNAIIEGVPANCNIDISFINNELKRRQHGYGRGGRMKIETDTVKINSGVRFGFSTGSPICLEIKNKDFENWIYAMSATPVDLEDEKIKSQVKEKKITKLRPGHADCAGALKYNQKDVRNILERSSARETATRVAVGAVAKSILKELGINIFSHVVQIGNVKSNISYKKFEVKDFVKIVDESPVYCFEKQAEEKMIEEIDKAKSIGTTLGGEVEIICQNLPVGLGSFTQWDKKLDGKIAQAIMSINAIKSVEFGNAKMARENFGINFHDEIVYENNQFKHKTNNAGGIEGGMTNGEDIVIRAIMKPIPTMKMPLQSVDLITKEKYNAHFERSDTCATPACAVVCEAMVAIILVDECLTKFGGDSIEEVKTNFEHYKKMISEI